MTVVAGNSGTHRQFTCTPITAGVTVAVSYSVPGFVGSLPSVPVVTAVNPAPPANIGGLNDTGITQNQCYDANSGFLNGLVACGSPSALAISAQQDGMVGRDANGATNGSGDGKLGFSFAGVSGGCVIDNITGLMWEVKTADNGLRDYRRLYTNGDRGIPGYVDPDSATAYTNTINQTTLCGFNNWRIPTAEELHSLVDYGVPAQGPTIDDAWFTNTASGLYTTSSVYIGITNYSWYVSFVNGGVYRDANTFFGGSPLRLVRSTR